MTEVTRPGLSGLSADQQRYVEHLEAMVGARTIAVSRNGKFPRWSFERWALIVGFGASIYVNAFYIGRTVENHETRIGALERNEAQYARKDVLDVEHRSLQAQMDEIRRTRR